MSKQCYFELGLIRNWEILPFARIKKAVQTNPLLNFRNDMEFARLLIVFASCLAGLFPQGLTAQNFRNDIAALRQNYKGNYSVNIRTEIISPDPQFPGTTLNGFLKVNGTQMHYRQGEEEVLHTADYLLIISHAEKNIIVDSAGENYNAAPLQFLDIDTLTKAYAAIKFGWQGVKKVYTITPKGGPIAQFTLTINEAGYLEKMNIILSSEAGGGSANIYYSAFVRNPSFKPDDFSPWRFVKKQGNKIIAGAAFHLYTIDTNI